LLSYATLLGSTTPRLFTPPLVRGRPGPCGCGCALTPATSKGFSCVQFASEVLGFDLMPWQRFALIHGLELLPDGRFRFRTLLLLVARQNGKTTLVEVKNLWKMFVLGVPLVLGTAQNLDVSEESWDKAVEIVESIPELAAELPRDGGIVRVNGKKTLKLASGSRWKVAAASRKGGRGLSGDDVNLDELREHHTWDSWAAVTKTTMARRNAQIWAFSNAGDDRSIVLNDLRDKALEALEHPELDPSLGILEYSAPDDCPIDDPQMWALANPSLGYPPGVGLGALRSALETDPEPIFRTECLCQRVPDLVPSKIPLTAWVKCTDPKSTIDGPIVLSWEVSWDRAWGSIAVAGPRSDGVPHLELIDYRPGTDWMPGRIGELAKRHSPLAVVFNPTGPGAVLANEITERLPVGLELIAMTARDQANACGRLYDAVMTQAMRHLGDDRLLQALRTSATRPLVDAWAWDLRRAPGEMSGLAAGTNALDGLARFGKPKPPSAPPTFDVVDSAAWSEFDVMTAGF
jgi:hypothetical protein